MFCKKQFKSFTTHLRGMRVYLLLLAFVCCVLAHTPAWIQTSASVDRTRKVTFNIALFQNTHGKDVLFKKVIHASFFVHYILHP